MGKRVNQSGKNPKIDAFLIDGCGRCQYFKTPQCKVNTWREELILLRDIVVDSELKEEYKWSQPCYTYEGKNVLIVSALKDFALISFFKGTLLRDAKKLLHAPGKSSQADRQFRFTSVKEVVEAEHYIRAYIHEAIEIEKQGLKVSFKKNPEPFPQELIDKFERDPVFEKAFKSLTPGRQRGYILHFSQPKQSKTRASRIEKCIPKILKGEGLHDRYKSMKR